jgi:hypothetical protein
MIELKTFKIETKATLLRGEKLDGMRRTGILKPLKLRRKRRLYDNEMPEIGWYAPLWSHERRRDDLKRSMRRFRGEEQADRQFMASKIKTPPEKGDVRKIGMPPS